MNENFKPFPHVADSLPGWKAAANVGIKERYGPDSPPERGAFYCFCSRMKLSSPFPPYRIF